MAARPGSPTVDAKRTWLVVASLAVLFVAALFLRAYWNLDPATAEGNFALSAGSDPYYHKRAIDHIQTHGFQTLVHDPLLNYPYGSINPNPPLYEWSVAVAGLFLQPFFGGDLETSTWYAFLWSPAVFGALTLFPIYFIAKSLFDRRAGLVAALFWTLSTASIDTTGLGSADHDAAVLFFVTLAVLFYVKSIERFRGDGHWVASWRNGATLGPGLSRFFRERRLGLGYAMLAGIAISAVALTWKGFPYVLGILFVYGGLQMVIDHWRSRDSTGVFFGTLLAMATGVLLSYPYYAVAGLQNFLTPAWFLVGAFAVGGLVLVPTRDLPTILVMPAALVAGLLGVVVAFFVFPSVAQSLLYAPVYFKQTALYQTIAEAHPADFSSMVFGIGPVPFFLALSAWVYLLFTIRRHPTRAMLFAIVWGAVAVYMAQSAIRFLFNAIPVFAVFAGCATVAVLDWFDFGRIRKALLANQGSTWTGVRKGVGVSHVLGVLLIVLFLVVPNVILAADAALPPAKEAELHANADSDFVKTFIAQRMGAYGQGFIPGYWEQALRWLDAHDANITEAADRPGFLAWWDYGHWAIYVGQHPAVADNFQNGYEYAANFILAQNETHAVQLLAARLAGVPGADAQGALAAVGASDPAAALAKLQRHEHVEDLTLAQSVDLLARLEQSTGKSIRYFAADVRMMPYDNPQTPRFVEESSIFYAPVTLAGRDPSDYVEVRLDIGRVINGESTVSRAQYEELARDPIRRITPTREILHFKQDFFETMYWRAYAGDVPATTFPAQGNVVAQAMTVPAPGGGLEHFRLVYAGERVRLDPSVGFAPFSVVILEYYPGAYVEGTVTEGGEPLPGVTVTAYDDAGRILIEQYSDEFRAQVPVDRLHVPHASTTTDADGRYRLVAPFALEGGVVTVVATRDDVEVGRMTFPITRADASAGTTFRGDLTLERGSVEGLAYQDLNDDGVFDETNDTLAANVTLVVAGQEVTTDADGRYAVAGVPSGSQRVSTTSEVLQVRTGSDFVAVRPGETAAHDVALVPRPATVSGYAWVDHDGSGARDEAEGVPQRIVSFTPDESVEGNTAEAATASTDTQGAYEVALVAGTYLVRVSYVDNEGASYTYEDTLTVTAGALVQKDLPLTTVSA